MVKKLSKEAVRGAIQVMKNQGCSNKEISDSVGVSIPTVMKCCDQHTTRAKKRVRKGKMKRDVKNFLFKKCSNKYTGVDNASSRALVPKLKRKFGLKVHQTTVNRWLKPILSKPRRSKKSLFLTKDHKIARKEFADYIISNNIKGKDIFFTDEKRFLLNKQINPQTNQVRLSKESLKNYKLGKDDTIDKKINQPLPHKSQGFMIAGGLSSHGVGKLIFCIGTMNSFAYEGALNYYKADTERLNENLFFQQDNAPCHTSGKSMKKIDNIFNNSLAFWPPNSPGKIFF